MPEVSPKVSVVVPVYQARHYIKQTLDCLLNQTLSDLEFIFIDDKGNDGTFDVVRCAASKDSRIVCIENESNQGPGVSRNKGIDIARGEYIAFVDADDTLSLDFYEKLYNVAKKTGAYIVKGQRYNIENEHHRIKSKLNEEIETKLEQSPKSMLCLWTYEHTVGIYLRNIVLETGARYCDSRQDEDTCFLMRLMYHIKPEMFAKDYSAEYYYRQHKASLVHHYRDAYYLEQKLISAKYKVDFLLTNMRSDEEADYLSDVIETRIEHVVDTKYCVADVSEALRDSYISYFSEVIHKWYTSSLPYRERTEMHILRSLNYNGEAYYSMRKLYRMFALLVSEKTIRKRIWLLKLKKNFSFGKKRLSYKSSIHHYRSLLREIKQFANGSMGIMFNDYR